MMRPRSAAGLPWKRLGRSERLGALEYCRPAHPAHPACHRFCWPMTPFARLLVVFHFLRQALGTQTAPSNQNVDWTVTDTHLLSHATGDGHHLRHCRRAL